MSVNIDIHRFNADCSDGAHRHTVIGSGQSGLAVARALLRRGPRPVALEASGRAAGSWPHSYDSLTLFSPARYGSPPGLLFPALTTTATRTATRSSPTSPPTPSAWPPASAPAAASPWSAAPAPASRWNWRAAANCRSGQSWRPSRTFGHPHRPAPPGPQESIGPVLHAADYRTPPPSPCARDRRGRGGDLRGADHRRTRRGRTRHTRHPRAREDREGLASGAPGLAFVALEWQRRLSSNPLRGAGRGAERVVRRLAAHLTRR